MILIEAVFEFLKRIGGRFDSKYLEGGWLVWRIFWVYNWF